MTDEKKPPQGAAAGLGCFYKTARFTHALYKVSLEYRAAIAAGASAGMREMPIYEEICRRSEELDVLLARLDRSLALKDESPSIDRAAHLKISVSPAGLLSMETFCFGKLDASYGPADDRRLLGGMLHEAIAELRLQVRENRRITVAESRAIRNEVAASRPAVYSVSGSAVTVNA